MFLYKHIQRFNTHKVVIQAVQASTICGKNEPILEYLKSSNERKELEAALAKTAKECPDIPICIGKSNIFSGDKHSQKMPHNHKKPPIAKYCYATRDQINEAIDEAVTNQHEWSKVDTMEKHCIWHKAADLIATKYRQQMNASIMLGQAKTVIQAEIDTVELIDFLRFGANYLRSLEKFTPISPDPKASKNTYHLRPLDGFVAAVTPFNFTAIGGNLAFTPTLLGNCTVWKPSDTAILSNYLVYKIMLEAGVPPGVVSFTPAKPEDFGNLVTQNPHFAGLNFTGSVPTFRKLWGMVSKNLDIYSCFPRLVGECGGKNYHFVHKSADLDSVVNGTIRAAFEYSGQKCSACSRMYVPKSIWPDLCERLKTALGKVKMGDVLDFSVFTSAVIDERAFNRIAGYLKNIDNNPALEIIAGGGTDKKEGYFICPTIIRSRDPCDPLMTDEIFGPVLAIYVYDDCETEVALSMVKKSKYALTGAIFANDPTFLCQATHTLKMTAGNFYINDKCTGSVVAQQPFGGSRLSGTNDKAGSPHYLLRWASPQIIKETYAPLCDTNYAYMK